MNKNRDYLPKCETNVPARMAEGASVSEGLSGRMTAQQKGAHYRTYLEDGKPKPEKKYEGYDFGY